MAAAPEEIDFGDGEEDWGPGAPPPEPVVTVVRTGRGDSDLLRTAARLVVGGAAEGGSILLERLRLWESEVEAGENLNVEPPDESRAERLRYAAVGLAHVGTGAGRVALTAAAAASEASYALLAGLLTPLKGSRVARPVFRRYERLALRGEIWLESLIDAGRISEQRSRALARLAYDDGSTEVIQVAVGKLSDEPAVRELVTAQGTSLAGDMIDTLRRGAAAADARVGRLFRQAAAAPAATGETRAAGFPSRLLALLVDVTLVTLASVVLGGAINLILNFFGLGVQQLDAGSRSQILHLLRVAAVALSALAVLLFVPLYFVVFWRLGGATPGKMLLGLRVVHHGSPQISAGRGLLRYAGYFLSALPLFLGFFWVLGDRQRQGWHDKLARTRVVYTWEPRPGN